MNAKKLFELIGRVSVEHGNLQSHMEFVAYHLTTDPELLKVTLEKAPFSVWADTLLRLVRLRLPEPHRNEFEKLIKTAKKLSEKRNEIMHDDWMIKQLSEDTYALIGRRSRRGPKPVNPLMTDQVASEIEAVAMGLEEVHQGLTLAVQRAATDETYIRRQMLSRLLAMRNGDGSKKAS